jgi:hypothetical protein
VKLDLVACSDAFDVFDNPGVDDLLVEERNLNRESIVLFCYLDAKVEDHRRVFAAREGHQHSVTL